MEYLARMLSTNFFWVNIRSPLSLANMSTPKRVTWPPGRNSASLLKVQILLKPSKMTSCFHQGLVTGSRRHTRSTLQGSPVSFLRLHRARTRVVNPAHLSNKYPLLSTRPVHLILLSFSSRSSPPPFGGLSQSVDCFAKCPSDTGGD